MKLIVILIIILNIILTVDLNALMKSFSVPQKKIGGLYACDEAAKPLIHKCSRVLLQKLIATSVFG